MSSISRRRNGLMALSVIGAPVLGEVLSPSISRQDASFCYSPRPFPCYKLPRERFSPSARFAPCSPSLRKSPSRTDSNRSPFAPTQLDDLKIGSDTDLQGRGVAPAGSRRGLASNVEGGVSNPSARGICR